jgi:Zn finger protein HypA/HybF involved in hydrogenase expression
MTMARFRCGACAQSGEFEYDDNGHNCPLCGSPDVVFAMAIEELPFEVLDDIAPIKSVDDESTEE